MHKFLQPAVWFNRLSYTQKDVTHAVRARTPYVTLMGVARAWVRARITYSRKPFNHTNKAIGYLRNFKNKTCTEQTVIFDK